MLSEKIVCNWLQVSIYTRLRGNMNKIYHNNIHTLSANITFIVRASEIEWKASLWRGFLPCFKATKDKYYVSLQYTYIVYLLQSHVCKTLNTHVHTKAKT